MPLAVGVDLGSTNTKVVVADASGPVVLRSRPTADDPATLVADTLALVADAVAASPARPVALGIASMAETGWGLDTDDRPCTGLLRWDAARDPAPMAVVADAVGADALFGATGVRPGPKPPLAAWLDLRAHQPARFARLRRWAGVADGVHLALTGRLRTDHTLAGRTLAYRLPPAGGGLSREFDPDLLALAELGPDQLPAVGLPGDAPDRLTRAAASATGLAVGTPVVVAGHDHQVAAWASGVREVGDVANSVGTAEALLTLVGRVPDRAPLRHEGMSVVRVLDGNTEAVLAGSPSSGAFLQWLADREAGGDVGALLHGVPDEVGGPSPGFWLPYPAGRQCPHPDADARVRHVGPSGVPGLESIEAVCLQAAWVLARQRELAAADADARVVVIGEPVRRTPLWGRLKATLFRDARLAAVEQPVACGAALLALVRAGFVAPDSRLSTAPLAPLSHADAHRVRLGEFVDAALGHADDRPG